VNEETTKNPSKEEEEKEEEEKEEVWDHVEVDGEVDVAVAEAISAGEADIAPEAKVMIPLERVTLVEIQPSLTTILAVDLAHFSEAVVEDEAEEEASAVAEDEAEEWVEEEAEEVSTLARLFKESLPRRPFTSPICLSLWRIAASLICSRI
jgi:hypothetical protein